MAPLPLQTMPFIGRRDEIAGIVQRLMEPDCNLLTLIGPGGMGKTRLAIEVAQTLAKTHPPLDGVYFVDLQPLNSGNLLEIALANALNLVISGADEPLSQLLSYLDGRAALLLLDNFEHVLDRAGLLAEIIKTAPQTKLLVTSREALNIQEEWLWQVVGLQTPDPQLQTGIENYSAVQLFVERARRVRQNFTLTSQETHVARICQLVEGMPLALELAASWTKALSCAEIADEIQHNLNFLTTSKRNMLERHQSMQAVFDYSWQLLTEAERAAFPQLSVFRGGFRREAAEQVTGASLAVLAGLVDKSFLSLSTAGRYEIHELIRQYGEEHLSNVPDAKNEAQQRHCLYYADFLHGREPILRGPEQNRALDEIKDDFDNVRLSWEWAIERDMLTDIDQSMHSLYLFCHIRAQAVAGERLFKLAVDHFEPEDSPTLTYLILAQWSMAGFNGRRSITENEFNRVFRLVETFWTSDKIAIHLRCFIYDFTYEGLTATPREERFLHNFLEVFRSHNQPWGAAFILYCLGDTFNIRNRFDEAEKYYRESLEAFLKLGDRWAAAWPMMGLGWVYDRAGRYREGIHYWQQHQDLCAEVGDHGGVVYAFSQKAMLAWKLQDFTTARFYLTEAIKFHLEVGSQFYHLREVFRPLIAVFVSEGRYERAAELSSFLWQHADNATAPEYAKEARHTLDSVVRQLPPDRDRKSVV